MTGAYFCLFPFSQPGHSSCSWTAGSSNMAWSLVVADVSHGVCSAARDDCRLPSVQHLVFLSLW